MKRANNIDKWSQMAVVLVLAHLGKLPKIWREYAVSLAQRKDKDQA